MLKFQAAARASLLAVKGAAIGAAEYSKKTFEELGQVPAAINCEGCDAEVEVPKNIYDWTCQCAAVLNPHSAKTCPLCKNPRPAIVEPLVTCAQCATETAVPLSNARKTFRRTGTIIKKTAVDTKQYTQQKFEEIKAPPLSVSCPTCAAPVAVPPELFDWQCPKEACRDLGLNGRNAATCEHCHAAKPNNLPTPSVTCGCGVNIPVPTTAAVSSIKSAAHKTKKFAVDGGAAAKKSIVKLASRPEEFECTFCTALLSTPRIPVEGGESKAGEEPQYTLPPAVVCGSCNKTTPVPRTNLTNALSSGVKSMTRSMVKVAYTIADTPYAACDRCSHNIKIPPQNAAEGGEFELICPQCDKRLSVRAVEPAPPRAEGQGYPDAAPEDPETA